MSCTSEDNARSKEMLLAAIDDRIKVELHFFDSIDPERRRRVSALIMNRNRVARFLNLPTRDFKERKRNEGQPTDTDDAHLV